MNENVTLVSEYLNLISMLAAGGVVESTIKVRQVLE